MELAPVHKAIITMLDEYLTPRGAAVVDGYLGDGWEIPTTAAGVMKPHAVVEFGDAYEHPLGASIDGPRNTLGRLPFTVMYVADSNYKLTQLRDLVVRRLVGQIPTPECGVIVPTGTYAEAPVSTVLKPQRYIRSGGFYLNVGAAGARDY